MTRLPLPAPALFGLRLVGLFVVVSFLTGCFLLSARPVGEAGSMGVTRADLPDPGRIDGDPVRSVLGPDAIPSLDDPEFVTAEAADAFMDADELVLGVIHDGVAKAYSLWHLDLHEVVNDRLGDEPVAVTW